MKKPEKPNFAKNIRTRRKALGFKSAKDFSEHIRIPYGTYRDIEAGYSEGWPQTKEAIAKGLKCAVGDLYGSGLKERPQMEMARAAAFLSKYASLSPELQEIVWAIVFEDETLYGALPSDLKRGLK